MRWILSSSEYLEKLRREKKPTYSSTFSGYDPKGASSFSHHIERENILNAKEEIEKNPNVINVYSELPSGKLP